MLVISKSPHRQTLSNRSAFPPSSSSSSYSSFSASSSSSSFSFISPQHNISRSCSCLRGSSYATDTYNTRSIFLHPHLLYRFAQLLTNAKDKANNTPCHVVTSKAPAIVLSSHCIIINIIIIISSSSCPATHRRAIGRAHRSRRQVAGLFP